MDQDQAAVIEPEAQHAPRNRPVAWGLLLTAGLAITIGQASTLHRPHAHPAGTRRP